MANYDWSAAGGGYLRVQDFFNGADTLEYLEADFGTQQNVGYSPDGDGTTGRVYFSAGTGTDQGNNFELILGTEAGETITDVGGIGFNRLEGYGGNDTLIASDDGPSMLLGGDGDDTLIGGTNDDELRGGSGSDDIDGGFGYDTLEYHRPATSGPFTHGVFVNLSDDVATYEFLGETRTIDAHTALDNWWDPDTPTDGVDTIANVEAVLGTYYDDVIIGGFDGETIVGGDGADILDGGVGEGSDQVSYYPPFGSPSVTQGVFVNISADAVTYDFNGQIDVTVGAGQALDNWGNTDTLANFENIAGSDLDDVLVAGFDSNYIEGGDGDDIIAGGGGYDTLFGGDGSDSFVFGTEWGDTTITNFIIGTDFLRFQGDVEIESIETLYDSTLIGLTSGAYITLQGVTGLSTEDIPQLTAPPLLGDTGPNTIDGTVFNDIIEGGEGADTLNGRAGIDTYVWAAGDGYDTVLANDDNQDIIQIVGSFYDYNFQIDGNDVLIGVAADDGYDFADVGGSLRLEDFLLGNDSIAYLEADLGDNNQFYSPEGGDARIYVNLVTGVDQGPYYELILGTNGNDVMTDAGGGGINRFIGYGGDDTITAADGATAVLIGGDGEDDIFGADQDDDLRGGADNDFMDGGDGFDIVRYDRPAASGSYSHGVFVNLSASTVTHDFNGNEDVSVLAGQAIDNWGDTDTLANIEAVRGSEYADVIFGSDQDNTIDGRAGDDVFSGGVGVDTYVWRDGDGYDTILANNDNQDIIQINGSFYDYNFQIDGNDVLIGVAADDNYNWADVGGNLRLEDFLLGNDSIAYLEADLGDNNEFYSPEGGDARIYVNLVTGTDQGPYYELILGTNGNDVMTDAGGGGINRFIGYGGDDIITAADGARATLIGGDDEDELHGADQDDNLRGGSGDDTMDGAEGIDEVQYHRLAGSGSYSHGVFVNLSDSTVVYDFNGDEDVSVLAGQAIDNWGDTDTLQNIENVRGSTFDDVLIGSDGDNDIIGDDGDDTIIAGDGQDYVDGGSGSDDIDGGDGYDVLAYNRPASSSGFFHGVFVNLSDDQATYDFLGESRTVDAHTALDNWWDEGTPTDGVDTIANVEEILGTHFDDVIIGGSEGERISGGDGADILDGGDGSDSVHYRPPGGSIEPTHGAFVNISSAAVTYDFDGELRTVNAGEAYDNWGNIDTLSNFENIIGSELGDILVAGSDSNSIDGNNGDDIIVGGGGNDHSGRRRRFRHFRVRRRVRLYQYGYDR